MENEGTAREPLFAIVGRATTVRDSEAGSVCGTKPDHGERGSDAVH